MPTFGWRTLFTKKPATHTTRAARIEPIAAILAGDVNDSIRLSLVPATGAGVAGIDFASASVTERVVLGALVRRSRPARIFEIGTFRGLTALAMAANCDWDARLWTLDLPPELGAEQVLVRYYASNPRSGFKKLADANADRAVGAALEGFSGRCRIEQLYGDAATFDFSRFSPIDLFFVDGCHEYEAAKRDTLAAWETLRPGGRIVWHDYTWENVERAIRDALPDTPVTWIAGTSIAYADRS